MDNSNGQDRGPSVIALMSLPRVGFTHNFVSAIRAFSTRGIPLEVHTGVFWHKSLTNLLLKAIDLGFDYAITIDFDSIFAPRDVDRLIHLAEQNPDALAVFPVQVKRETDQILMSRNDPNGKPMDELRFSDFASAVSPADAGHFGLTVLRLSALKELPHPWLLAEPDEDGKWSDASVDFDIYFWRKARREGHTILQANDVWIGQIEQRISWPAVRCEPVYEPLNNALSNGTHPVRRQAMNEARRKREAVQA